MNTMNKKGTTSVKIIEFLDDSPKLISESALFPVFIIGGTHEIVVKFVFIVVLVAKD